MSRIVDLTHWLRPGQPVYPGDPEVERSPHDVLAVAGYNTSRLAFGSHAGTHLDAPRHFFDDGKTVGEIPLAKLCGPACMIDLAPGGSLPPGTELDVARFGPYARRFHPGARVLYRTGWEERYGTPEFFTDQPSLTPDAARWMAECGIALLGMDTPSPAGDPEQVHRILLGAGIVIVEALAGLARLPEQFTFAALPPRFADLDGAPVRAVAWVE